MLDDIALKRFWDNVDKQGPDDCWEWIATRSDKGYPLFHLGMKKYRTATRIAWEIENKIPFPKKLLACHRCDNPPCVNPAHIWAGTHSDNTWDSVLKNRWSNKKKTHCYKGHQFTPENTCFVKKTGHRVCLTCSRANWARRRDEGWVRPSQRK